MHKNATKTYFCLYNLHIFITSDQTKFLFFRPTFEYVLLQKATFDCFWQLLSILLRNYGKLFGKSRTTCGKPYKLTVILEELRSVFEITGASVLLFRNFSCNLTFYESENFSGSSLHHILESEKFRWPFFKKNIVT